MRDLRYKSLMALTWGHFFVLFSLIVMEDSPTLAIIVFIPAIVNYAMHMYINSHIDNDV